MARDFNTFGEAMVRVKGRTGTSIESVEDLGMSLDAIRIIPRWLHEGIHVNDFGPEITPEVMSQLADVTIRMNLIHFDDAILKVCMSEAMATSTEGTIAGAGIPLGGGDVLFGSKCRYISLNIVSGSEAMPNWHFPTAYLTGPAVDYPIGTEKSVVALEWKAIPYRQGTLVGGAGSLPAEILSAGVVLWDHTVDTN